MSVGLVGKYVDIYEVADGRFDVRWKRCTLPYSVFDKQRITHAVVTESKRLGEVDDAARLSSHVRPAASSSRN